VENGKGRRKEGRKKMCEADVLSSSAHPLKTKERRKRVSRAEDDFLSSSFAHHSPSPSTLFPSTQYPLYILPRPTKSPNTRPTASKKELINSNRRQDNAMMRLYDRLVNVAFVVVACCCCFLLLFVFIFIFCCYVV
jgi:hypothetical protein